MGTKIIVKICSFFFVWIASLVTVYGISNGFYKAIKFDDRYCYVRNDTIWFNYDMPIGFSIRFAKGLIQNDGTISILEIKNKLKTRFDTVSIKRDADSSKLKLNLYDFRTVKEIVTPISYLVHEDYTKDINKRIFFKTPFEYDKDCYVLDYTSSNIKNAVLTFSSFKNEYDLSNNFEPIYIELRKGEVAHYRIVLAPSVTYSEHFQRIAYSYKEKQSKITLSFTKKIHGFPDYNVEYFPVEKPEMNSILWYVYSYYIYQ
jgi:hypothetical protein